MIISSVITHQVAQVDGRIDVTEQHTHADGSTQVFGYLADAGVDFQSVANLRAANINAELTRREQELQLATNFEIPLSDIDILKRITPAEWEAFKASTNATVKFFFDVFMKAKVIHRNDPLTVAGFDLLVAEGILTVARRAEVLA